MTDLATPQALMAALDGLYVGVQEAPLEDGKIILDLWCERCSLHPAGVTWDQDVDGAPSVQALMAAGVLHMTSCGRPIDTTAAESEPREPDPATARETSYPGEGS